MGDYSISKIPTSLEHPQSCLNSHSIHFKIPHRNKEANGVGNI